MQPELSNILLAFAVPLVVLLALKAPLHVLFLIDFALVVYPGEWLVSGVHLDFTDLLFAGIGLALILRPTARREIMQWRAAYSTRSFAVVVAFCAAFFALLLVDLMRTLAAGGSEVTGGYLDGPTLLCVSVAVGLVVEALRWRIPCRRLWIVLAVMISLAYVTAPINSAYLTRALGIVYQVYRYCWRPLLFFPLAVLLLGDRRKLDQGFLVIVAAADACALMATWQVYGGAEASGPFITKNQLAGVLIVPMVLAVAGMFRTQSRWSWRFYAASVLAILRGLLSAGSRGAFVGVLGALAFFAGWLLTTPQGRSKSLRLALAGVALGVALIAVKPDLFQRPMVQQFLTIQQGMNDDNMRWRIEERWPYFREKIWENPWLGTGTDLYDDMTPHNGYLGIAVVSGIPAALLIVALAVFAIGNGVRTFRHGTDAWQQIVGIGLASAVVGLLIHNLVEETFQQAFAAKAFWLCAAAAAALARRPAAFLAPRKVVPQPAAPIAPAPAPLAPVGALQ